MLNSTILRSFIHTILIIMMLQSCSKDKPERNVPKELKLLTDIEWNSGNQKDIYDYDPTFKLKSITYTSGQTSNIYDFTWAGNKITEMYERNSPYKNFYYYNGDNISYMMNSPANDPSTGFYKTVYTYLPDSRVDKMDLFVINGADPVLQASTSYHYNAARELTSSVTIMGDYIITQKIESYTEPVEFNPWGFIDLSLQENYMIFNFPVLRTMKGFPVRIIRSVKIGNDPEFADILTTNTCEISNRRINKMTVEMKVPQMPSLDKTRTAKFSYR